jgi:ELWxxDGT repeat protein
MATFTDVSRNDSRTRDKPVYAGDDAIVGTDGDDVILGWDGSDTIISLSGRDRVWGDGKAADTDLPLDDPDANPDLIDLGPGDDEGRGGGGPDTIFGRDGDDFLGGQGGDDTLDAGAGDDEINGHQGADRAQGGEGNDTIAGGPGDDTLDGGPGDDLIRGLDTDANIERWYLDEFGRALEDGANSITGGDGNDTLIGGDRADTIIGGDGDDDIQDDNFGGLYSIDRTLQSNVFGDDGDDIIAYRDTSFTFATNGHDATVEGGAGSDTIDVTIDVYGYRGRSADVTVSGDDGDDQVTVFNAVEASGSYSTSSASRTFIGGGEGDDTLMAEGTAEGVAGADIAIEIHGDQGDDVIEARGGGAIFSSSVYYYDLGTVGIALSGDDGDDSLIGEVFLLGDSEFDAPRGGASTLQGGSGDDRLTAIGGNGNLLDGGSGDDTLTGSDNADIFVLRPRDGADVFVNFQPGIDELQTVDGLSFEALDFAEGSTGAEIRNLTDELLAILEGVSARDLAEPPMMIRNVTQVADINAGPSGSNPLGLTDFGGELFFKTVDGLWKVGGNGQVEKVSDISPDGFRFNPPEFQAYNGELHFAAFGEFTGSELWKVSVDGSVVQVADINQETQGPFARSSNPSQFTPFQNELIFSADDGISGTELWKVAADGAVVRVADINAGREGSMPREFTHFNDSLYFSATDGETGRELWKLTASGDVLQVADINHGSSGSLEFFAGIAGFQEFGGALYFSADDGVSSRNLWKIDGDGQVVRVADAGTGKTVSSPFGFTEFQGNLYFSARSSESGQGLWKLSPSGDLMQVSDIAGQEFTEFDGSLYFSANDGKTGLELWRLDSDGKVIQVADIDEGVRGSVPRDFTTFEDDFYFTARTLDTGREIYKVAEDGRINRVADIDIGPGYSEPQDLTQSQGNLYFSADDGESGRELWKVPGTQAAPIAVSSVGVVGLTEDDFTLL